MLDQRHVFYHVWYQTVVHSLLMWKYRSFIQAFSISHLLHPNQGWRGTEAYLSCHLARSRVHPGQVAGPFQGQHANKKVMHTHVHGITGWRKKYLKRTHACMGRTCELHTEKPLAEIWAGNFLTLRHHCVCRSVQLLGHIYPHTWLTVDYDLAALLPIRHCRSSMSGRWS